jgi:hypothetical protein
MEYLEDMIGEEGLAAHADYGGGISAERTAREGVDLAFVGARGSE